MNNGAFKKFSGLLNLQDYNYIETLITLNTGNDYTLPGDLRLNVLPAFHDEVIARDQSIGLLFSLPFGDETRKVLFTSDTGLFPLKRDERGFVPDTDKNELWQDYPEEALTDIDLLVVHIGSINKKEIDVDLGKGIGECLYPNHLGVIGTTRMISKLAPKLAVVSEFGEEMRLFRCDLVKQIQTFIDGTKTEEAIVTVPGDLAFIYNIEKRQVLCCAERKWMDSEKVKYGYTKDNMEHIIYFSSEADIAQYKYEQAVKEFYSARSERSGMYFG